MSGSTAYGGVQIDTGVVTAEQAVATISGTSITNYDSADLPAIVVVDANLPERKPSPDGVSTIAPNINQVSLNAVTATSVRSATPTRQLLNVRNLSSTIDIYVGTTSGVTTSNGYLLRPYESIDIRSTTAVYGISASGTPSVCYLEEVSA